VDDGVVGIPGHVEDGEARALTEKLRRQAGPADPGHHDVGEEEVDRTHMVPGDSKRVCPVRGFENGVALLLEDVVRQPPELLLVLDEKDRPGDLDGGL